MTKKNKEARSIAKEVDRRNRTHGRRAADLRTRTTDVNPSRPTYSHPPDSQTTFQTEGATYSPGQLGRRGTFEKLADWLTSTPSATQLHHLNLVINALAICVSVALFAALGVFTPPSAGLMPGELEIAGEWKYNLQDRPDFRYSSLDDTGWCPIQVPNSGLPPVSQNKPAHCPKEHYPRNLMRNNTYWYRKSVTIPDGKTWEDPALFLGAIKERAWVYWDDQFQGIYSVDRAPITLHLSRYQTRPGKHLLAVRVQSVANQNPGLFHAYPRTVVLGEYGGLQGEMRYLERANHENVGVIIVQFLALLILMILLIGERGSNERHTWLGIYFLSSLAVSTSPLFSGDLKTYVECGSLIFISISLMGYGANMLGLPIGQTFLLKRAIALYAAIIVVVAAICVQNGPQGMRVLNLLELGVAMLPVLFFLVFGLNSLLNPGRVTGASKFTSRTEKLTAGTLLITHLCMCTEIILTRYSPVFFHPTLIVTSLTLLVAGLAVHEYVKQQTAMAFFGRFIRPGLRSLLQQYGREFFSDQKLFRGRKIPIMKIDVVGHTASTFSMPYGVKRLFQDLFFTHVDYVVADRIFLDRSEGDGSIYFFDERLSKTPCTDALEAAFKIREAAAKEFDREFRDRLAQLLKRTPELHGPMSSFETRYAQRTNQPFSERRTLIRVSFVYGYVDEGLWGLTSQSHYGLEGDLMTLLSRLERNAGDDEILVSKEFADQVAAENKLAELPYRFDERQEFLKGIGNCTAVSITKKNGASAAA
jgi:hypothetical protein